MREKNKTEEVGTKKMSKGFKDYIKVQEEIVAKKDTELTNQNKLAKEVKETMSKPEGPTH